MDNKIQLKHPQGKKAISIDQSKYDPIKEAIIQSLKLNQPLSHKELFKEVSSLFNKNNIPFSGSIEWYLEWVKLDLEAKGQLIRIDQNSSLKFKLP